MSERDQELQQLRDWKQGALIVSEQWDEVWSLVKGRTADLGKSQAAIVKAEIERLRTERAELLKMLKALVDLYDRQVVGRPVGGTYIAAVALIARFEGGA